MYEYPKINTVFKRDLLGKLILGDYSLPEFEYLANNAWDWTEKIDGTNIRVVWNGKSPIFKGKTDRAQIPEFLYTRLVQIFIPQIDTFKEIFNTTVDVCLYGEGYGKRIQRGGGNYRQDQSFVLFDIKIGHWWLQRKDVEIIGKNLGLDVVPIIGKGTLRDMVDTVQRGLNSKWGDFKAEGIVARPIVELRTRSGDRIITKLKNKDFI